MFTVFKFSNGCLEVIATFELLENALDAAAIVSRKTGTRSTVAEINGLHIGSRCSVDLFRDLQAPDGIQWKGSSLLVRLRKDHTVEK